MSGPAMVNVQVDGRALQVAAGTTVLKAADAVGIEIPRFCFHPAFEPEGSCRMCLVEIEGLPKLDLACSTVVREGMKVWTSTPKVLQARRDVLEFLLADHPLDCPICDKAGECFLQEYYDRHGRYPSRFIEDKEKKAKKVPIGKNLLLDRERCVLCTRCVRFLRKVTGTGELGVFERGVRAEIGIDAGAEIGNNYSGNLVDVCPVGAITDTDFRFKTRVWFMDKARTVCPRCGRGCNIFVHSVSGYPLRRSQKRVFRVVPAENPAVNGYWICDVGRYGCHELDDDRRLTAGVRGGGPGDGQCPDWDGVIKTLAGELRAGAAGGRSPRLTVILSSFLTNEELEACRRLFVGFLGAGQVFFADPKPGPADGFLLTADRAPNGRGADALGFTRKLPVPAELSRSADLLLIFGTHLLGHFGAEEMAAALRGIGRTYLFSAHLSGLDGLVDVVLPTVLPEEKRGSFTNIDGLTQSFEPAVRPPLGPLAEREVLARLAGELGAELG